MCAKAATSQASHYHRTVQHFANNHLELTRFIKTSTPAVFPLSPLGLLQNCQSWHRRYSTCESQADKTGSAPQGTRLFTISYTRYLRSFSSVHKWNSFSFFSYMFLKRMSSSLVYSGWNAIPVILIDCSFSFLCASAMAETEISRFQLSGTDMEPCLIRNFRLQSGLLLCGPY